MRRLILLALTLSLLTLSGCSRPIVHPPRAPEPPSRTEPAQRVPPTQRTYTVLGQTYHPIPTPHGFVEVGTASWYGPGFHGLHTACGERYDMYAMTAAHRILPMHTQVRVTNLENGREVILRINDRGPFAKDRVIDLSYAAARKLDVVAKGTARVRVEALNVVTDDIPGLFYVQAGSFTDRDNAHRLKSRLVASGFAGTRVVEAEVDGFRFWRVQAGTFNGLRAAEGALASLIRENPASFILAD
jgi:rare lipoprotein A